MRWVRLAPSDRRFLLHPTMTDPHHSCLISSNKLTNNSPSLWATILPRSNSETWSKDARCIPRGIVLTDCATVVHGVRLRHYANDLHVSLKPTYDVNFICAAPYRWIPIAEGNFGAQLPPKRVEHEL
ncbi:hypothetical protein TNCV_572111 [Trichonephila clavipes]|nr:hypothetical protein TNCV_572111 [Trichonephila clavipes]